MATVFHSLIFRVSDNTAMAPSDAWHSQTYVCIYYHTYCVSTVFMHKAGQQGHCNRVSAVRTAFIHDFFAFLGLMAFHCIEESAEKQILAGV